MAESPPITVKMQAWVYFVTWIQYAANHITRKCYTNVKNVMIPASRDVSRHRRASSPGMTDVGGFFVDYE